MRHQHQTSINNIHLIHGIAIILLPFTPTTTTAALFLPATLTLTNDLYTIWIDLGCIDCKLSRWIQANTLYQLFTYDLHEISWLRIHRWIQCLQLLQINIDLHKILLRIIVFIITITIVFLTSITGYLLWFRPSVYHIVDNSFVILFRIRIAHEIRCPCWKWVHRIPSRRFYCRLLFRVRLRLLWVGVWLQ